MDTLTAIHTRRSIRAYEPRPVDRAVIAELLHAAAQAPTPPVSGDDPFAFHVIEGVERIAALGDAALQHARAVRPPDSPWWSWTERSGFKVFWDAPVLVLICARTGLPEARMDCCRAGQNLVLAAHALGLGSCWVGAPMPWLASAGVAGSLGIDTHVEPHVAIVLGHPAEAPIRPPRPMPAIRFA